MDRRGADAHVATAGAQRLQRRRDVWGRPADREVEAEQQRGDGEDGEDGEHQPMATEAPAGRRRVFAPMETTLVIARHEAAVASGETVLGAALAPLFVLLRIPIARATRIRAETHYALGRRMSVIASAESQARWLAASPRPVRTRYAVQRT